MKTLEQFRETGRNTLLKNTKEPELYGELEFGREYELGAIALLPTGQWLLVIANASYEDWDVRNLEEILYKDFFVYET